MTATYTVSAKKLSEALTKAIDTISMGDTSSNSAVLLTFNGEGVEVGVQNSTATYTGFVDSEVSEKAKTKQVIVESSTLSSYLKKRDSIALTPNADNLVFKTKGFNANLFYLGTTYELDREPPEETLKINKTVREFVDDALTIVADLKDRVAQKNTIIANLVCDKDGMVLSTGDSHHVVSYIRDGGSNSDLNVNMSTVNMRRIFGIGGKLSILENRVVGQSKTEYLSINSTIDSDIVSIEVIKPILESFDNKKAYVLTTASVLDALSSLSVSAEQATSVTLTFKGDKLGIAVQTASANAALSLKIKSAGAKVKDKKAKVNIFHILDVVKCMKVPDVQVHVTDNMVLFMAKANKEDIVHTTFAAVSIVGEG